MKRLRYDTIKRIVYSVGFIMIIFFCVSPKQVFANEAEYTDVQNLTIPEPTSAPEHEHVMCMYDNLCHRCISCNLLFEHSFNEDGECSECGMYVVDRDVCYGRDFKGNYYESNITWTLYGDEDWFNHGEILVISGSGPMVDYYRDSPSYPNRPWEMAEITTVVIEEGVETIGAYAFSGAGRLENVIIKGKIKRIGDYAFHNTAIKNTDFLMDGITYIGSGAFSNCLWIENVVIPDSVEFVGSNVFESCYFLKSAIWSRNAKQLYTNSFYSCLNLTSVVIPEGVEEIIGRGIFSGTSIKRLVLPASVKMIGGNVFSGSKLEEIIVLSKTTNFVDGGILYDIKNATVYGYKDSTAEKYIDEYGYFDSNSFTEIDMNSLFDVISYNSIAPTCFSDGYDEYVTTEGIFKTNVISATGHSYTKKVISDDNLYVEADCVSGNKYLYFCEYCNRKGTEIFEDGETDINNHDFSVYVDETYHKCSLCGKMEVHNSMGECLACGEVRIQAMSLELNPDNGAYIGVNLYVDTNKEVIYYLDGVRIEPQEDVKTGSYNKIQFRCAAKEFADNHCLTVYDSDNKAVSIIGIGNEYIYSGMDYCNKILNNKSKYSDELIDVCLTIMEYNKQTKNYFGYNTDGLVVEDVMAEMPDKNYEQFMAELLPEGCGYIGSSLILGDSITLRHYFTGDMSVFNSAKCTNVSNSEEVSIKVVGLINSALVYIDIPVSYSNVGDMYKLEVWNDYAYRPPYALKYGVLTYCRNVRELQDIDKNLVNTCNSLYNFYLAINKYFR